MGEAALAPSSDALIRFGRYALDPWRNVLMIEAREVALTPLAARLLEALARRPGETVERTELIETLWRGDWRVGDPALHRVVSELRRAVGDDPRRPTLVQTVPRQGYRLVAEGPAPAAAPAGTPAAAAAAVRRGLSLRSAAAWSLLILVGLIAAKLAADWITPVIWLASQN